MTNDQHLKILKITHQLHGSPVKLTYGNNHCWLTKEFIEDMQLENCDEGIDLVVTELNCNSFLAKAALREVCIRFNQ